MFAALHSWRYRYCVGSCSCRRPAGVTWRRWQCSVVLLWPGGGPCLSSFACRPDRRRRRSYSRAWVGTRSLSTRTSQETNSTRRAAPRPRSPPERCRGPAETHASYYLGQPQNISFRKGAGNNYSLKPRSSFQWVQHITMEPNNTQTSSGIRWQLSQKFQQMHFDKYKSVYF